MSSTLGYLDLGTVNVFSRQLEYTLVHSPICTLNETITILTCSTEIPINFYCTRILYIIYIRAPAICVDGHEWLTLETVPLLALSLSSSEM